MASSYDVSALTLNTEEAKSVSEAIRERIVATGQIARFHEVIGGIKYDTEIPFVGTLGLVGKSISGCGFAASPNALPVTSKKWAPKRIGDKIEHCEADLPTLWKLFSTKKKGTADFFNQLDTEGMQVVASSLEDAILQMYDRISWFGDSAAAVIGSGGVYNDSYAAEMVYYTPVDGYWKQIMATAALQDGGKYHVNIDLNEAVTKAAQKVDPDEMDVNYARNLFKAMLNKRDPRFKQAVARGVMQIIHCTPELAENYVNWLEDKSLAFTLQRAEDGTLRELRYRDTTIIPRYDWRLHLEKQDNGTIYNLPHRALLTVKENIPIGVENFNELGEVKSHYSEDKEVNVMKFVDWLDFKFLEDYMAVVAY